MSDPHTYTTIDTLTPWDKNPRGITKKDFARLKAQIKKFGQYKPLLINQDGVVLGGNMRYRAYKDLGIKKVWVSRVETANEQEMVEYALSDNDRAGYYEDEAVAELAINLPTLDADMFSVDVGKPKNLQDLVDKFGPGSTPNPEFVQLSFTLSDEQADVVREGIATSRLLYPSDESHGSAKGNALYMIVKRWLEENNA